jgi:hypothetical protein
LGFPDLLPYYLDVIIVLGQDPSKIPEQIYLLQHFPFYMEQLMQSQGRQDGRVLLCPLLRTQQAHLCVDVPWVRQVALHREMLAPWEVPLLQDLHGVFWV